MIDLKLLVILFVIFSGVCKAQDDIFTNISTEKINYVVSKLNLFVLENKSNSELTSQDLKLAYEEVESWDPKSEATKKLKTNNFISCVSYMLVPVLTLEPGKDVEKLESTYKLMREPCELGYMGKSYSGGKCLDTLTRALMIGSNRQEQVTKQMLEYGSKEYQSYLKEFIDFWPTKSSDSNWSDIVRVDWLLQYFNNVNTRILSRSIYPLLPNIKTDDDAKALMSIFTEEMQRYGRSVTRGEFAN